MATFFRGKAEDLAQGPFPGTKTPVNVVDGPKAHGNSLDYVGDTHVYVVKGPNGTHKVGESMQGVRKGDGPSIRGEQQARRLFKETGEFYKFEIRRSFPNKFEAREFERKFIETFRRLFGEDTLPAHKTNR